jgi:hypothetical protein
MVLGQGSRSKEKTIMAGKKDTVSQVKQVMVGMKKHFPNGSQTIPVGGAVYTVDQLLATLQAIVDNREAVQSLQAQFRARVETERTQTPSQVAVLRGVLKIVRGMFGNSADALADFGLAPPKARTPMTAEQVASAVAKRAATRSARGTKGKVQKKAVKGKVTGVVVTPVTAEPNAETHAAPVPAAPAPAPSPATTGTPAATPPQAPPANPGR